MSEEALGRSGSDLLLGEIRTRRLLSMSRENKTDGIILPKWDTAHLLLRGAMKASPQSLNVGATISLWTGSTNLTLLLMLSGCLMGDEPIDNSDGDEGEIEAAATGNVNQLNIGFNDGHLNQFDYYPTFFDASPSHSGPRLCHAYFSWDIAYQPPTNKDVICDPEPDLSSRKFVHCWFKKAQNVVLLQV